MAGSPFSDPPLGGQFFQVRRARGMGRLISLSNLGLSDVHGTLKTDVQVGLSDVQFGKHIFAAQHSPGLTLAEVAV